LRERGLFQEGNNFDRERRDYSRDGRA